MWEKETETIRRSFETPGEATKWIQRKVSEGYAFLNWGLKQTEDGKHLLTAEIKWSEIRSHEDEIMKWRALGKAEAHFGEMEEYMDEETREMEWDNLEYWRRDLERGAG